MRCDVHKRPVRRSLYALPRSDSFLTHFSFLYGHPYKKEKKRFPLVKRSDEETARREEASE
jgi:hypothetical protein